MAMSGKIRTKYRQSGPDIPCPFSNDESLNDNSDGHENTKLQAMSVPLDVTPQLESHGCEPEKTNSRKLSFWTKLLKSLSVPGQRNVDRLTRQQCRTANQGPVEALPGSGESDLEQKKRQTSGTVENRIQQYIASGH